MNLSVKGICNVILILLLPDMGTKPVLDSRSRSLEAKASALCYFSKLAS